MVNPRTIPPEKSATHLLVKLVSTFVSRLHPTEGSRAWVQWATMMPPTSTCMKFQGRCLPLQSGAWLTLLRLYQAAQAHHRNWQISPSLSLLSSCASCLPTPLRSSTTPTMRPSLLAAMHLLTMSVQRAPLVLSHKPWRVILFCVWQQLLATKLHMRPLCVHVAQVARLVSR